MNDRSQRVLAIGAHPDDVEFMCAGLLALLKNAHFEVHFATMSSGDCGSLHTEPEPLRQIRQAEAEKACRILGAAYHPLDFRDLCIFNDDPANRRVTALMRQVDPQIVITHSPQDYLSDHEATSTLVRNACFYAPVPNYKTSESTTTRRTSSIPFLYYAQPMEGIDIFGEEVLPHFYIDVSAVFPLKMDMLSCHESQHEWLKAQHGMDEYVESMRRWSRALGERASAISPGKVEFAEAYRQHRGHAYPRGNIIGDLLGKLLIPEPTMG
jgi:LmbE family N-acetylglucosaminyl deacetylase